MHRRRFVLLGAAYAAGLAVPSCAPATGSDDRGLARPALLEALGPARVRAIGAAYRRMAADERDAAALRAAIRGSRPWTDRLPWSAPSPPGERVRSDFDEGRTVVVDGWVLSITEARQCALYSLLPA